MIQSVSVLKTASPCLCVLFWPLWGCNSVALPPFFPTLFRTWTVGTTLTTLTKSHKSQEEFNIWQLKMTYMNLSQLARWHIFGTHSLLLHLTGRQSGHQLWMRFCRVETHVPAPRSLATSFLKSWQKALAKLAVPLGACTEICLGIFTVFAKGETELAKWHWKKS